VALAWARDNPVANKTKPAEPSRTKALDSIMDRVKGSDMKRPRVEMQLKQI
jgi:hypothetical protein